MYTILRNVRFNELGRNKNGAPPFDIDEEHSRFCVVYDKSAKRSYASEDTLKEADVTKAIEGLPLVYREIILLREVEDLSYEEIAQVLNCPARKAGQA